MTRFFPVLFMLLTSSTMAQQDPLKILKEAESRWSSHSFVAYHIQSTVIQQNKKLTSTGKCRFKGSCYWMEMEVDATGDILRLVHNGRFIWIESLHPKNQVPSKVLKAPMDWYDRPKNKDNSHISLPDPSAFTPFGIIRSASDFFEFKTCFISQWNHIPVYKVEGYLKPELRPNNTFVPFIRILIQQDHMHVLKISSYTLGPNTPQSCYLFSNYSNKGCDTFDYKPPSASEILDLGASTIFDRFCLKTVDMTPLPVIESAALKKRPEQQRLDLVCYKDGAIQFGDGTIDYLDESVSHPKQKTKDKKDMERILTRVISSFKRDAEGMSVLNLVVYAPPDLPIVHMAKLMVIVRERKIRNLYFAFKNACDDEVGVLPHLVPIKLCADTDSILFPCKQYQTIADLNQTLKQLKIKKLKLDPSSQFFMKDYGELLAMMQRD